MEQVQLPEVGQIDFSQTCGETECRAVLIEVDEYQSYARVEILESGQVVWSSPPVDRNDHDLAFGTWYDGNGLPCWFGDIDGDGKIEMLASVPKADMTPTRFRVFRWSDGELTLLRKEALLWTDADNFAWSDFDPDDEGPLAWIDFFQDGEAHIVHRRRATVTRRTALLEPNRAGFSASS